MGNLDWLSTQSIVVINLAGGQGEVTLISQFKDRIENGIYVITIRSVEPEQVVQLVDSLREAAGIALLQGAPGYPAKPSEDLLGLRDFARKLWVIFPQAGAISEEQMRLLWNSIFAALGGASPAKVGSLNGESIEFTF